MDTTINDIIINLDVIKQLLISAYQKESIGEEQSSVDNLLEATNQITNIYYDLKVLADNRAHNLLNK